MGLWFASVGKIGQNHREESDENSLLTEHLPSQQLIQAIKSGVETNVSDPTKVRRP